MITLHVLQLLADNALGVVAWTGEEEGADLFWEKMPQDKAGVWIVSRGIPLARGMRASQTFDLYSRGTDDLDGMKRLERIMTFFEDSYGMTCEIALPSAAATGGVDTDDIGSVKSIAIMPSAAISNAGQDAQDRIVWNASAVITYNRD